VRGNSHVIHGQPARLLLSTKVLMMSSDRSGTDARAGILPDPRQPLPAQWPGSVAERFAHQAQRRPVALALHTAHGDWTYAELDRQAARLANYLRTRGIGPQAVVAIHGSRGPGLAWAVLGVLKARAVFALLDPAYPAAWRQEQLRLIRPLGWIRLRQPGEDERLELPPGCAELDLPATQVQPTSHLFADLPELPALPAANADDLAYLAFTSGTTGSPKGIEGTQRPLSHFLSWHVQSFGLGETDRFLLLSGIGHDLFLRELFTPWWCGGTLCIPDHDVAGAPETTAADLREQGVTVVHLTPSTARLLCQTADRPWPSLRLVCLAGEPLRQADVALLRRQAPAARCVNFYGATETPQAMSQYLVPAVSADEGTADGIVPIGRGIDGVQLLVLTADDRLGAVGETGEICVRTPYLARGYLREPELTRQRFVVNPWTGAAHDRLYRTGDLGYYRSDGNVAIAGRRDEQLKIRGFRVEPLGIEALLAAHPDVREAAVVGRPDGQGAWRLATYLVPRPGATLTAADVRAHLRQHLPHFMVPASFRWLDRLPRTPRGKLDRTALVALDHGAPLPVRAGPRTPLETNLAAIWQETLGVPAVGIHDNFFDLGGHSLNAIRMSISIREQTGVAVRVGDLFECPTIAAQALWLVEQLARRADPGEFERLLTEVEAAGPTAGSAAQPVAETGVALDVAAVRARYGCPSEPSPWFGRRACSLVLVINDRFDAAGFERTAAQVRAFDPLIQVVVARDEPQAALALAPRPTLVVAPAVIRQTQFRRGRVFCGYPYSKSEEYTLLQQAGFRVPRWAVLTRENAPDLEGFGDYVVRKPNYGGRGSAVRLVPRKRLRWKPLASPLEGMAAATIVQDFVYTGPHAVNYRVNCLFGQVLYCVRHAANDHRPSLAGPADLAAVRGQDGFTIVASSQNSQVAPSYDADVIALAESAHRAFPLVPLLGFDIVREVPSGVLYILEANAIGYVWYFDGRQSADFGFSLERQFDGLRKAAYVLAERTQQLAQ
jgi:amino acid adenylation domain-containing protein